MIGRYVSIIDIIVLTPMSGDGDGASAPAPSDENSSGPHASNGLMELVTRRVESRGRIRSQIARPIAAPAGLPTSGISLPIEYMITDGWFRSLRTMASTSASHQSGNTRP